MPGAGTALLFDLDGTMLDTDRLHLLAWNQALEAAGLPALDAEGYSARVMGLPNGRITADLHPGGSPDARRALAEAKEGGFRARLGAGPLAPLPGLGRLLDAAEAARLPMAVVTNAPRENARAMLRGLGWEDRFPVLVIGEELPRPKPDPMPYAVAMERLGVAPADAVAFEDSASGLRAAAASGAFAVGIGTTLDAGALREAGAALVARDFADRALAALLRDRAGLELG